MPQEENLAVWIHDNFCKNCAAQNCSWAFEIYGIEDDWDEKEHRYYLEKANRMLEIIGNCETIQSILKEIL